MQISLEEARARIIQAQGLNSQSLNFGSGKAGVQSALEHLSYVQIDTISVIERAHHHILYARLPDYQPLTLNELVAKDKTAFEYWAHAAAFLPMRDYRFSLPRKRAYAKGLLHWFVQTPEHDRQRKIILRRLKSEGPLQSKDFERPSGAKNGWFERTPAKAMLEQLFMEGVLMISERKGFQKVYDLTERVLPANVNTDFPTAEEMAQHLIRSWLRIQSFASEPSLSYARKGVIKDHVHRALKKMIRSGEISPIAVENVDRQYFILTEDLNKTPQTATTREVKILSPFDPFVIQRQRLLDLFQFNYQIECYVPLVKRKYGYFTLPLLYKNQLVGVIDTKAHRQQKKLEVCSSFLRSPFRDDSEFRENLKIALQNFSLFNGCEKFTSSKRFSLYRD